MQHGVVGLLQGSEATRFALPAPSAASESIPLGEEDQSPLASTNGPFGDQGPSPESQILSERVQATLQEASRPVFGDEAPEGASVLPSLEPKPTVGTTTFPSQYSPSTGSEDLSGDPSSLVVPGTLPLTVSPSPATPSSTRLVPGPLGTADAPAETPGSGAPSGSALALASSDALEPGSLRVPGEAVGASQPTESASGRLKDFAVNTGPASDGTGSTTLGAGGVAKDRGAPVHSNGTVHGSSDAVGNLESLDVRAARAGGELGQPPPVPVNVSQEFSSSPSGPKTEEAQEQGDERTLHVQEQSGAAKVTRVPLPQSPTSEAARKDSVALIPPEGSEWDRSKADGGQHREESETLGAPETGPLTPPAKKGTGEAASVPAGGPPPSLGMPQQDPLAATLPRHPESVRTGVEEPGRLPGEPLPPASVREEDAKPSPTGHDPLGGAVPSRGLREASVPAGREVRSLRVPEVATSAETDAGGRVQPGRTVAEVGFAVGQQLLEKPVPPGKAAGAGASGTVLPVVAESSTLLSTKSPSKGGLLLPKQGSGSVSPLSPGARSPSSEDGTLVRSKVDFNPLL